MICFDERVNVKKERQEKLQRLETMFKRGDPISKSVNAHINTKSK